MDKLRERDGDWSRLCLGMPFAKTGNERAAGRRWARKMLDAGCSWWTTEVSNHPRDDISPRTNPAARRSSSQPHNHAASRSPSGLCGPPRTPPTCQIPGHHLANADWRDGVRLLRRWRVQVVGAGALVTCLACSSCVASACIRRYPVAGAPHPGAGTLNVDLHGAHSLSLI